MDVVAGELKEQVSRMLFAACACDYGSMAALAGFVSMRWRVRDGWLRGKTFLCCTCIRFMASCHDGWKAVSMVFQHRVYGSMSWSTETISQHGAGGMTCCYGHQLLKCFHDEKVVDRWQTRLI